MASIKTKMTQKKQRKAFFVHPHALVDEGVKIGPGTRVWAFAHILAGAVIGRACNVCDHTLVEGKVRLGNRVTIKCGVHLWDGLVIEDDVFIGPSAVFTNDLRPRSKRYSGAYPVTLLKQGCSIGANSTILPGITIGAWAMVAAGCVVTRDVPAFAQVLGNPARQTAWVCRCGQKIKFRARRTARCQCGERYSLDDNLEVSSIT
jgi:acetyltransferase-like isoleucine patch superfamily enzyme